MKIAFSQHGEHLRQKLEPADPSVGRIGVGEVLPEIAERGRSEERVAQRVADDITVGMAKEARLPLEVDSAEVQRASLRMRVHVQADPDPRTRHG